MTAQELRIGNYITQDGDEIHGIVGLTIHKFSIGQIKLEPIPLTEEWLLKFGYTETGFMGFEKGFSNNSILHIQFMAGGVITGFIEGDSTYVLIGKIDFVHQLQNLCYTLTGKELTI